MSDDADTQVIDAPMVDERMDVPPGPPDPTKRGGPGWPIVMILALLALGGLAFGAWAYADAQDTKDEIADLRDDLDAAQDQSAAGSEEASDEIDSLKEANAKLTAQLKKANAQAA